MKVSNQFIQALLEHDREVLQDIYREVAPSVRSYVLQRGGKVADAKDVLQDALLVMLIKLRNGELGADDNFKAYLIGICRNLWLKKISRERVIFGQDSVFDKEAEEDRVLFADKAGNMALLSVETVLETNKYQLFKDGLAALSERCRDLLVLRMEAFSYEEIKVKMNFPSKGRVGKKLHDCKRQLKKIIRNHPDINNLFPL